MSTPQMRAQWGKAFADAIEHAFPNIAAAVRNGLTHDCAEFIQVLQNNSPATSQIGAVCVAVEEAMNHIINRNANLENEKVSLRNDLSNLHQQHTIITGRLEEARLNNSRSAENRPRRTTTDPKPFSGEEKDVAKRQTEYVNWRSQLIRAFSVDESTFTNEFVRLQHIAGRLEGTAYRLYRKKFDNIMDHKNNPDAWHWRTYTECFAELNKQYETLDLSQTASQAFDNLWMTNKPFQNFIAEFNSLAEECGKTDAQKVEALQLKVSQELSDEMSHQLLRPGKEDFHKWCEMYQSIYDKLISKNHYDKLRNARPNARQRQTQDQSSQPPQAQIQTSTQPSRTDTGDPMVLDASQHSYISREQCIQQGLCLYCKKPGHLKNDCTEKNRADARRQQAFQGWNPNTHNQPGHGRGRGQLSRPWNNNQPWNSNPYTTQQRTPSPAPQPPNQYNYFPTHNYPQTRLRTLEPGPAGDMASSACSSPSILTPETESLQGKE
jgi:Retrotransposon gag protein